MSKQYLQTHTLPSAHPTDIFALTATASHILSVSGSSSILIHRTPSTIDAADTPEPGNPTPLAQTLEKVHPLGCHHICASADGKAAATIGFGGELKLWSYKEDEQWHLSGFVAPIEKKAGEHWAIALAENGQYLACTTHDGSIRVYDTTTLTLDGGKKSVDPIVKYETKGSFGMSVDISPDGAQTASGHQNGGVYIFSNNTRRLAHSCSSLVRPVRTVKFSPKGKFIAAAGDAKVIALYDAQGGEQVAHLTGHGSWIMSLDWNWSGELLLSGCQDGKAKVWSIERRECVATQTEEEGCLWAVKWIPKLANSRTEAFVTAGAGGRLAFYREGGAG